MRETIIDSAEFTTRFGCFARSYSTRNIMNSVHQLVNLQVHHAISEFLRHYQTHFDY